MILGLTFLVMIVGLIMFLTINKPERAKVATVGLVMFAVGLGVFLLKWAGPAAFLNGFDR